MKTFTVTIDVTMSGDVDIEANTKEEAIEKAKKMHFSHRDLTDFHQIDTEIVDVLE